jgi:protein TonB
VSATSEEGADLAPEAAPNAARSGTVAGTAVAADLSSVLPRLAGGDTPQYPRMSRRIGEEGWVEVALDVQEDGEVLGLAITASSGSQRLDEAALAAARTWRFLPRTGPRGVDRLTHRIVFRLTRD